MRNPRILFQNGFPILRGFFFLALFRVLVSLPLHLRPPLQAVPEAYGACQSLGKDKARVCTAGRRAALEGGGAG